MQINEFKLRRSVIFDYAEENMNKHKIGNAIASLLFLVVAFVFYTHNDSGVGTMFVVFAAVYLGLTFSDKYKK